MVREKKKILIVGSDADLLVDLERMLEDAGFETTTTWNSRHAVSLLETHAFDLMLIGEHPPEVSSIALLKKGRSKPHRVQCIILRSAALHPFETEYLCSLGAQEVTSRWDLKDVMNKVKSCLHKCGDPAESAPNCRAIA